MGRGAASRNRRAVVDGACAPVVEAHAAFKQALATGRLHANHLNASSQALLASEVELREFAGS